MRKPTSTRNKRRSFRRRNFRAEYQARVNKGLAAGKSRSAARGHPTAADLPKPSGPINRASAMEKALARMKRGASQRAAANAEGVSVEKLRIYRQQNTTSARQGRMWAIFDLRPQEFWLATRGQVKSVTLARDEGSDVSAYWRAVDKFLYTNNAEHLRPFVGRGVRDVQGRFHQFETGPNTLRKLDAIDELSFVEIYADVAT